MRVVGIRIRGGGLQIVEDRRLIGIGSRDRNRMGGGDGAAVGLCDRGADGRRASGDTRDPAIAIDCGNGRVVGGPGDLSLGSRRRERGCQLGRVEFGHRARAIHGDALHRRRGGHLNREGLRIRLTILAVFISVRDRYCALALTSGSCCFSVSVHRTDIDVG